MLVLGGAAMWSAIVLATSGLGGFFVSYGEYLQATAAYGALLGLIWLALGCGLVLSVTGRTGWLRTAATAAFALLSMVVLPMGLRGEVMFRGVAAMVAAGRCGRILKPVKATALLLALLAPHSDRPRGAADRPARDPWGRPRAAHLRSLCRDGRVAPSG